MRCPSRSVYKKSLESALDVLLFSAPPSASRVRRDDARRVRGLGAAVLEFASDAALHSRSLVQERRSAGDSLALWGRQGLGQPVDGPVLDSVTGWSKPLSMQRIRWRWHDAREALIRSSIISNSCWLQKKQGRSEGERRHRRLPLMILIIMQWLLALLASALCFSPPCFMLR